MTFRYILAGVVLASGGPACADTTAVYQRPTAKIVMTLQIADNGDLRGDVSAPGSSFYAIIRGGQGYIIQSTPTGQVVDRVEDLSAVMDGMAAEEMPQFRSQMKDAFKGEPNPFIQSGTVTINGRTGDAYYFGGPNGPVISTPVIVISHDPSLAPIGRAMSRQFKISMAMGADLLGRSPPFSVEIAAILDSGTPLLFAGASLATVNTSPIAPSRFDLPVPPESREAILKRLRATSTSQPIVGVH